MISVSHLVKRYGSRVAVDDVTFEVGKGEVVGFLGPNGAGKSTTLRILAGFLGPTAGTVTVDGHDVVADSFEARKVVGYMPETAPLYPEMRVAEYLGFRAELKRVPRRERVRSIGRAMEQAHVTDVANNLIGTLSKGYRQRVGLADALVASPPILILDEPTAGMDPNQIREVRTVVKALGESHTVLLSTHILSEVEATCSRVVVISRGKLVAEGATSDLASMRRSSFARVTVRGALADAKSALRSVDGLDAIRELKATRARGDGDVHTLRFKAEAREGVKATELVEQAVSALVRAGVHVRDVRAADGSLEDLFAELTAGDRVDGGSGDDADEEAS